MSRAALLVLLWAPVAAADGPEDEAALAKTAALAKESAFAGDPQKGWTLFHEKKCMRCHAVWGLGEDVGPDLGRAHTLSHVSAGELAGTMWNHVPRMREKMEEQGIRFTPVSVEEMGHLFAFLLFIRYTDEPGDPARGERVLTRYRCKTCHSIGDNAGVVGPDLQRWAGYVNPVVWAQKMWRHAPAMQARMAERGIAWPTFQQGDLVDIVAFIRARSGSEGKDYLEPGSPARGRRLFEETGCAACHAGAGRGHKGAVDLDRADLPDSLAGIASEMWNHAPIMLSAVRKTGAPAGSIQPQEMADIIAYLITRRYFLAEGDPIAGRKRFVEKRCVACHSAGGLGSGEGRSLRPVKGEASPVLMAHVMWHDGPKMLDEMARQGIPWPNFEGTEMADLIAFLNEQGPPR